MEETTVFANKMFKGVGGGYIYVFPGSVSWLCCLFGHTMDLSIVDNLILKAKLFVLITCNSKQ